MQQGMLFHSLYARQPGVDVEQLLFTLPETLQAELFERAWRRAAQRHAILRTTFRWHGPDQPQQVVHADPPVDLTWHDWRALSPADREHRWEELLAADRRRGFQLDLPPLWRLTVAQTTVKEHRFAFTFHHLLLDGRGVVVLLTEVFAAYGAYLAGTEPPATPPVAYRAYIDWLQTRDWREAEMFWRRVLRGMIAPTALPGARTGPPAAAADNDTRHREQQVALSAGRTAKLKLLTQRHGLTLNTLVQGAWALLLGRYSGEEHVVFGAVRACRHTTVEGAESIVGLLINTVPLRVALPPEMPALAWLQQLREHWIALRPYENTPLAEIQGWSEVPRGTPLFESLVNYQEPSWDTALKSLGGAWRRRQFGIRSQPNYPLALDAAGGATLTLKILYDPARFADPAIHALLGHLTTLLTGIAEHPQMPLGRLPLLTAPERQAVLTDWNSTRAGYPDDLCVHHLFEKQALRSPGAVAVVDQHRHLTYRDLNTEAGALARHLCALGIGPDVCVGVCLPRSVDLIVCLLAVLKAGGAYVPLDPDYPPDRLTFMLKDAQAPVLLTLKKLAPIFSAPTLSVIYLDGPLPPVAPPANAVLPNPGNLAYVIFTSGSTGTPKGVAIQHASVANLIAWHLRTYQVTPADRTTQLASPAFDASVWEIWPYLAAGASIHIPPDDIRLDPHQLVPWLENRRISICFLPTPLAEAVMDETWPDDTALRVILTGGDRLRRWPGERLPCSLVNHYGPTENTVVTTSQPVSPEPAGASAPLIGTPIANTEIYVLDAQRQLLPVGVPGELYVGGVGLARGYYRRPELTHEKFVPHPFRSGARLYRTGDLVRWCPGGALEFLGRVDQQLKVRGHRIEPAEIEARLNTHAGVQESLVVPREDALGQLQLVAYLLLPPGAPAPAPRELAELLRASLPAYMVPAAFVAVASWPLTANGKIDRTRLPAPDRLGYDSASPFAAPQGETEETIARVWTEVLGRASISAQDDFFGLGGHSLRAAQVVSRLNLAFRIDLPVRTLFEHPTLAALAREIETRIGHGAADTAPAITRVRRNRYRPTKHAPAAGAAILPQS